MENDRRKDEDASGFIKVSYKRRSSRPTRFRNTEEQPSASVDGPPIPETLRSIAIFGGQLARTVYDIQLSDNMKLLERILDNRISSFNKKMIYPSELTEPFDLSDGLQKFATADEDYHVDVVCYGLGRFLTSPAARTQLALLLVLGIAHCGNVYVFDPVFSEKEKAILRLLSINVLDVNEEGKRTIARPTVFFMPYCPHELYNNLLWANWSAKRLSKMIIIGNSFKDIVDDLPSRYVLKDNHYLFEATQFAEEIPLPISYSTYFHGLTIHTFNSEKLSMAPEALWLHREEPEYFITEMITCK